jgi:hypothetical protein
MIKIMQQKAEARHWWLTPVILATWEAEIVQGHPGQIVCETSISKITRAKWLKRQSASFSNMKP